MKQLKGEIAMKKNGQVKKNTAEFFEVVFESVKDTNLRIIEQQVSDEAVERVLFEEIESKIDYEPLSSVLSYFVYTFFYDNETGQLKEDDIKNGLHLLLQHHLKTVSEKYSLMSKKRWENHKKAA